MNWIYDPVDNATISCAGCFPSATLSGPQRMSLAAALALQPLLQLAKQLVFCVGAWFKVNKHKSLSHNTVVDNLLLLK